jgi:LAS superfamily LD-carboxypeptidase LdcB
MDKKPLIFKVILILIILAALSLNIYLFMQGRAQNAKITMLLNERNFFLLENASTTKAAAIEREVASSTITELSQRLALTTEELEDIERDFRREKNKNDDFEDQIKKISGTVGVLDKLSKTDEELLQKYSRTYFLNENFIPMKLSKVADKYVLPGKKEQYFHGDALEFLADMLDEAKEDGIDLKIVSAYRSFDEQEDVKGQFTQIYGSGSNAFSADQGYSEHQLGTTVDFTDPITAGAYLIFANTKEYQWLLTNAHRFGFILSYPSGNTFYIFEPWHWRFVGVDLASDLHKAKANFYEWDQRKIDDYLITIFD